MEKKLLLISDAERFSAGTSRFMKLLGQQSGLSVKGLFLDTSILAPLIPLPYGPLDVEVEMRERNEERKSECRKNFRADCEKNGFACALESNTLAWIDEDLARESRFADLVLISEDFSNSPGVAGKPGYFLESVLQHAECPVIVVPESFHWVTRIAVAYDGTRDCMYALRNFISLLPALADLPVELVYFPHKDTGEIPDQTLLKEYVRAHFDASFVSSVQLSHGGAVIQWLKEKKDLMLVAGSYGRTGLSSLLKKSFSSHIISTSTCPVFVAHSPNS